jgi:SAM-dependent methyltransferase
MTPQIITWLKRVRDHIGRQASVLEIGALNVNGSAREVFGDADTYVGTDMQAGRDVDVVINGHDLLAKYDADSFDLVICCETLEHDDQFWLTVENMRQLVKPGGWLIITNPGTAVIRHNYPGDFYRFFSDAYKHFFRGFTDVWIEETPTNNAPQTTQICGVGKK